jgi:thiol-disulfide isomerase/thioredoxin
MKLSAFITFTLLLLGTQCRTQQVPQITGTVTLSDTWKPVLYLVQPRSFSEIAASYSGIVIDSARIAADGSFAFSRTIAGDNAVLVELCIQKVGSRYSNQLLDDNPLNANYMPLVIQKGERIEIAAEANNFQATFSLKQPSPENLALLHLRNIRHEAFAQQREWLDIKGKALDESSLLKGQAAVLSFQQPLMAFADSCSNLLPSLVAARWVSTVSDYERVPEFIFSLCQKWQGKNIDNQLVAQLCQAGNRERLPVLIGDIMPNEALPMERGDTVLLQTLLGKKLTILDIWASWCMPCRRENRETLVPLWTAYKSKGLQVLGYSIDSSPGAWKAAIAKDGAAWPHASHLSGDATPFLETLRISTIPANFILDAQGEIIAKNLHGDELKAFVENYMK